MSLLVRYNDAGKIKYKSLDGFEAYGQDQVKVVLRAGYDLRTLFLNATEEGFLQLRQYALNSASKILDIEKIQQITPIVHSQREGPAAVR